MLVENGSQSVGEVGNDSVDTVGDESLHLVGFVHSPSPHAEALCVCYLHEFLGHLRVVWPDSTCVTANVMKAAEYLRGILVFVKQLNEIDTGSERVHASGADCG